MSPKALLSAIVGSLCSVVVVLGCWNYTLHRRIDRLEQAAAVQQRLNTIQDQINAEQERWDDDYDAMLQQETEANQL